MAAEIARCFAGNLLRARGHADISQEELSFRASIHRTEISSLERGLRVPRIDTLVKVAASLSVSPCDLLAGMSGRRQSPAMAPSKFEVAAKGVEPYVDRDGICAVAEETAMSNVDHDACALKELGACSVAKSPLRVLLRANQPHQGTRTMRAP